MTVFSCHCEFSDSFRAWHIILTQRRAIILRKSYLDYLLFISYNVFGLSRLIPLPEIFSAILVERNPAPLGHQLLNPYAVGKHSQSDLVTLALEIEKVSPQHLLILNKVEMLTL